MSLFCKKEGYSEYSNGSTLFVPAVSFGGVPPLFTGGIVESQKSMNPHKN